MVCATAYMRQKNKQIQGIGMYALAHTRSKQERGTERRRRALKVPERARKKRACARKQEPASGVAKINSARSQIDTRAPHTVVSRTRRCCKGLEPSRRLSRRPCGVRRPRHRRTKCRLAPQERLHESRGASGNFRIEVGDKRTKNGAVTDATQEGHGATARDRDEDVVIYVQTPLYRQFRDHVREPSSGKHRRAIGTADRALVFGNLLGLLDTDSHASASGRRAAFAPAHHRIDRPIQRQSEHRRVPGMQLADGRRTALPRRMEGRRDLDARRHRRRRQQPAVRSAMPVIAPPRQPDRPLLRRRPRCKRAVGPVRPAARQMPAGPGQPSRDHRHIGTDTGVTRAPISAYCNVAVFDLPGCERRDSLFRPIGFTPRTLFSDAPAAGARALGAPPFASLRHGRAGRYGAEQILTARVAVFAKGGRGADAVAVSAQRWAARRSASVSRVQIAVGASARLGSPGPAWEPLPLLLASLLGPAVIAIYTESLSVPVWVVWWWLVQRGYGRPARQSMAKFDGMAVGVRRYNRAVQKAFS